MTQLQVPKRETVDHAIKFSKHFLLSVSGGVRFLLSCSGNHTPILQGSHCLTPPQHCCFIEYGLHHRRNDEKIYQNSYGRKEIRRKRAEGREIQYPKLIP